MEIFKGQSRHIPVVMQILRRSIQRMEEEGIYQWRLNFYPTREIVERDVINGELYLLKKGRGTLASMTLNAKQSPEYKTVNWAGDGKFILVVHRLVVDPFCQGQGNAGKLMDYAYSYALENGYTGIRLDAYSGNPRAIRLYEGLGYRKAGQVYFPARELPFNCYEKEVR